MTDKPIMACGCQANAIRVTKDNRDGVPSCAIHDTTVLAEKQPEDLVGRQAICCGEKSLRPSSDRAKLAFFEYRGEGSKAATTLCKNCGYFDIAHGKPGVKTCEQFEPRGAYEYDRYYCGCRGWD